jgi:hypothetical protein
MGAQEDPTQQAADARGHRSPVLRERFGR